MEKGTTPTRGIRNNNPLNIRRSKSQWRGTPPSPSRRGLPEGAEYDPEFCQFIGMEWGFRAAFVTIKNYIGLHHCNTIERIVSRWCPPSDGGNQTEKYIKDVCRLTGIGGRAPLAASDPRLKDIVWAMAQIESGKGILAYREAMDRGWEMAADTPKPPQRGGCREEMAEKPDTIRHNKR